jgi:hypothetical protein
MSKINEVCCVCKKKVGRFSRTELEGKVLHDTCSQEFNSNRGKYGAKPLDNTEYLAKKEKMYGSKKSHKLVRCIHCGDKIGDVGKSLRRYHNVHWACEDGYENSLKKAANLCKYCGNGIGSYGESLRRYDNVHFSCQVDYEKTLKNETEEKSSINEENAYLKIEKEFNSDKRKEGLWVKSLTLSEGDELKAKYKYIELRVLDEINHNTSSNITSNNNNINKLKIKNSINNSSKGKRKENIQDHWSRKTLLVVYPVMFLFGFIEVLTEGVKEPLKFTFNAVFDGGISTIAFIMFVIGGLWTLILNSQK